MEASEPSEVCDDENADYAVQGASREAENRCNNYYIMEAARPDLKFCNPLEVQGRPNLLSHEKREEFTFVETDGVRYLTHPLEP